MSGRWALGLIVPAVWLLWLAAAWAFLRKRGRR